MSGKLVALLVAINEYKPPVNALYGCRNDAAKVEAYLRARVGDALDLRTVLDADATRQGVIDAVREHLGRAGPDDVALLYYSGHGTEEPAPADLVAFEPTKTLQTLVLVDSGRRVNGKLVRGLADKELALLVAEVAAKGPHVVVMLDCCHSGSGTRDPEVRIRQWVPDPDLAPAELRADVAALAEPRALDDFLEGTVARWQALGRARPRDPGRNAAGARGLDEAPVADHVALAACQSFQVAKEQQFDGAMGGAFTQGLLGALASLGALPSYRSLLAAVRSRVERSTAEQTPVLYPTDAGGPADVAFLGGAVALSSPTYTVTFGAGGWEVDAGSVHGLADPVGGEDFRLACLDAAGAVAGVMRVAAVSAGRSQLEPVGWAPDEALAYPSVVCAVPLPPATVTFDEGSDAVACDLVRAALAASGPGGKPSVDVVEAAPEAVGETSGRGLRLRIATTPAGFRVLRADGTPAVADIAGWDATASRRVVATLEHLARWERFRSLANAQSRLDGAVVLDVFAASKGEKGRPADRKPMAPGDGAYELSYVPTGATWQKPYVYLELRNTTDRNLFVAVIDLTDRYESRVLFATARLTAGHAISVWPQDRPVPVSLPKGREPASGVEARDWLLVVVSEEDFDASRFTLPELGQPAVTSRGDSPTSTLARLAARAVARTVGGDDDEPPPRQVADWSVTTVPLVVRVP